MKYLLTVLIYIYLSLCSQIFDDFTNQQLVGWSGDTAFFTLDAYRLRSNGPNAAQQKCYIYKKNQLRYNTEWNISIDLKFNPTQSNLTRIYLTADSEQLSDSLNGYFLQFGETGADTLDFYMQRGKTLTKLLTGKTAFADFIKCKVRVRCDTQGLWSFLLAKQQGAVYTLEGTVLDNTLKNTTYFGIYCQYATASRWQQFYFDDIYIQKIAMDSIAPHISSAHIKNDTTVHVAFSEKIAAVTGLGLPGYSLQVASDSLSVWLVYKQALTPSKARLLSLIVSDGAGNTDTLHRTLIYARGPKRKELLITEIMADESPSQGLPEYEYLEIYNNTEDYLSTGSSFFLEGSKKWLLPDSILTPRTYYLLCAPVAAVAFNFVSNKIVMPLPTLSNEGKSLHLRCDTVTLDEIHYAPDWYNDADKKEGGWALERIDLSNFCDKEANWKASVSTLGGTPSTINSINGTIEGVRDFKLLKAVIHTDSTLYLKFNFTLGEANVTPLHFRLGDVYAKEIRFVSNALDEVLLKVETLDSGRVYPLAVLGMPSCAGTSFGYDTSVVLCREPKPEGLLINEVQFNVSAGGAEYIEVYNASSEPINLNGLELSKRKDGRIFQSKTIIATDYIVLPKDLVVFTENALKLSQVYGNLRKNHVIELDSWPVLNNDTGTILLHTRGKVIDQLHYDEKMHHPLVQNPVGVSLEKIRPTAASGNATVWRSAAASAGFGTPTLPNSQYKDSSAFMPVYTKVITPNGDGTDDYCHIDLSPIEGSQMVSITVIDGEGRLIKNIARHVNLASNSQFAWDGTTMANMRAPIGQYLLHIEYYDHGSAGKCLRYPVAVFE